MLSMVGSSMVTKSMQSFLRQKSLRKGCMTEFAWERASTNRTGDEDESDGNCPMSRKLDPFSSSSVYPMKFDRKL